MTSCLKKLLSCGVAMNGLMLALAVTALATALIAEHIFGLAPCTLCIYQRVPYFLIALLSLIGFVFALRGKDKAAALTLFLTALLFLGGSAIAFYHTGVEQHWWVSILEGCKINFDPEGDFLAMIEKTQAVRCDEIPWADPFFGLSMAGWNTLISAGLFILALSAAIMVARRANGVISGLE